MIQSIKNIFAAICRGAFVVFLIGSFFGLMFTICLAVLNYPLMAGMPTALAVLYMLGVSEK